MIESGIQGEASVRDMAPVTVEPSRFAEAAGYILVAFGAGFPFFILVSKPLDQALPYGFLSVLWVLPFVIAASILVSRVTVDSQGITCQGLGKQAAIPWEEMEKIRLFRGSAGLREITVYGCRTKISMVNELFFMTKTDFWPAARLIVAQAHKCRIPVQAGFWGRGFWSHPAMASDYPDDPDPGVG